MSLRQRYVDLLARLAPAGAVGMALLLGSAAPAAASQPPLDQQPAAAAGQSVSARLAAIREAVSTVAAGDLAAAPESRLAQWGNWRNWHNNWANVRWHNWRAPWANYWHNAPWGNWHNFWHNY